MVDFESVILTLLIFLVALLYALVGHAGASGYLAAMALFGVAPGVMKPAALVLNILVAAIAAYKFGRAGLFSWSLFWPFAVTSVPFAFVGGAITLPGTAYKILVGLLLLYAGARLLAFSGSRAAVDRRPTLGAAVLLGAGIGLLSGLIGVGGGIFLSPLLLFMGWAEPRTTAGISAVFILVNSVAALLGNVASVGTLPPQLALWSLAAVAGGWLGAGIGSRRLPDAAIRRLLALLLIAAGLKMMLV